MRKALKTRRFRGSRICRYLPSNSARFGFGNLTRNQVVAQAARGFESHPVLQRKVGESNGFTGFYFICGYLISSHDSKSISLIYYPQRHPAYFCFQSRAAGSTFIYQNRTPFIRHCSLTSGVRFTFKKRSGQTDFVYSFELVARKRYSIISLLDLWGRFETQNYITVNILRRLDAYRVFCFV